MLFLQHLWVLYDYPLGNKSWVEQDSKHLWTNSTSQNNFNHHTSLHPFSRCVQSLHCLPIFQGNPHHQQSWSSLPSPIFPKRSIILEQLKLLLSILNFNLWEIKLYQSFFKNQTLRSDTTGEGHIPSPATPISTPLGTPFHGNLDFAGPIHTPATPI